VKAQQANCRPDRFDACVRNGFRVFTNRKHQSKFEGICQNINLSLGLCQVGTVMVIRVHLFYSRKLVSQTLQYR